MNAIYEKKHKVEISDSDFNKNLKLSSVFKYFQEAATFHADSLGIGFNVIEEKHGVTWVLTKIKVEIEHYPLWNEELIVETWPHTPKKVEFQRDFYIKDTNGNRLMKAISYWMIIDIKTRELRKSELIAVEYPEFRSEYAIEGKMGKLRPFGDLELVYKKVISYSDIDINGHLNNARYIDFVMDCFSVDSHKKYKIRSIQISFLREAFPGETIAFYRDLSALDTMNAVYIEGKNESSGELIFNVQFTIGKA